jgi:phage terminase large subunit
VARLNGRIIITTSPYTTNWLYKDLIKPTQSGKRDDVELISASSIENPYYSKERYYQKKKTMDPRRFKALFDGQFTQTQGLVYPNFSLANHISDDFVMSKNWRFFAGVDWGFTDPFVMLIHAIAPDGTRIQISEFYQSGLKPSQIVEIVSKAHNFYGFELVFCDPSNPGMIEELCSCEAKIPAIKGENDILTGIGEVWKELQGGKFFLKKDSSPYTIDEFETYHFPSPEDLKPDQNAKDGKPVDQSNHCLDAMRYIVMGTRHCAHSFIPHVPSHKRPTLSDDTRQRIAMLKRNQRRKDYAV